MAYSDDLTALSPDHRIAFDGSLTDTGGAVLVDTGMVYTSTGICSDVSNCTNSNGTTDRVTIPTTTDINNSDQSRKTVGGWFSYSNIQAPPKRIYGEGVVSPCFQFVGFVGNFIMFEVVNSTSDIQIFGPWLEVNRPYHLLGVFSGSEYEGKVKFFVDGVEMFDATPVDRVVTDATLLSRGIGEFADPVGTVGIGGTAVIMNAPVNGSYNEWCFWTDKTLTDEEIRVELFEKGALADVLVTNQSGIDTLAETVRPNAPCCIEVEDGVTLLTLDNITFDPLSSIHIRYNGTGSLTVVNNNGSNCSIVSAPWGDIEVVNPATLTILGLIDGCEVRVYDDEIEVGSYFDTELSGAETNTGTSYTYLHSGVNNTVIVQMIADGYEEIKQYVTLGSADQSVTLFPKAEANI